MMPAAAAASASSISAQDSYRQVFIRHADKRDEYELSVLSSTTVNQLKTMALVHFDVTAAASLERKGAEFGGRQEQSSDGHESNISVGAQYTLMHVGQLRRLASYESLHKQDVNDGACLLLMPKDDLSDALQENSEMRSDYATSSSDDISSHEKIQQLKEKAKSLNLYEPLDSGPPATQDEVFFATQHLIPRPSSADNTAAVANTMIRQTKAHSQLLLRRVLLGVAHCSLRLIGDAATTQQAFDAILVKLDKRHKSNVKPESIKKFQEMGFSDSQAAMALKIKSSVQEAADWLLERSYQDPVPPSAPFEQLKEGEDPVRVLMPQFWHFRRKYYLPHIPHYEQLLSQGYTHTRVLDALMQTENDIVTAKEVLRREVEEGVDLLYTPPPRSHPVMSSIMSSSLLQCGLNKPKVLYALLALCENPNNANLWLSDPDTRDVVNLILKVYHEERYNELCAKEEAAADAVAASPRQGISS